MRGGADTLELAGLQAMLQRTLEALAPHAGAASVPPVSEAPLADAGDPLALLRQLRQLLVERNMRSVTASEQLAAAHGAALGPDMAVLAATVSRLDFARALKQCDLLLDRLNPR